MRKSPEGVVPVHRSRTSPSRRRRVTVQVEAVHEVNYEISHIA